MTLINTLSAHTIERKRLPAWLRRDVGLSGEKSIIEKSLETYNLHTVCTEARCPNKMECFSRKTATMLILGERCTRACAFCAVGHGPLSAPDPGEPERVAAAVKQLGLRYIVITSVTRDDQPDGGAALFAQTVRRIQAQSSACGVEVLVPDFNGDIPAIATVCKSYPTVFAHNMETVPRLYAAIRPQAGYQRSLTVLAQAAATGMTVKTGLMVGLGETYDEVIAVMRDTVKTGCSMITIGQYLQPTDRTVPVARFVTPEEFKEYNATGHSLGFKTVVSGPFVRSSYCAEEAFMQKSKE